MQPAPLTPLEYASPAQSLRPVNLVVARAWMWAAIASVSVGVAILLAYRLSAWAVLVDAGAHWLLIGGGITTLCLIVSATMLAIIKPAAFNAAPGRALYRRAFFVSLFSYAAAFGCLVLGANWVQGPHFRLRVYNDTGVELDRVTAHFNGGDVRVSSVPAHGSRATGLNWVNHTGDLYVTIQSGSYERTFRDRTFSHIFHLQQPYFDIRIEPEELPKPLRP